MYKLFIAALFLLFFVNNIYSQDFNLISKNVASDRAVDAKFGGVTYITDNIMLVGAPNDFNNITPGDSISNAGSVYIYKIDSLGNWQEFQKIVASNRATDNYFGAALCANDSNIIVGAPYAHGWDGTVYFFKKDSLGYWQETQLINGMVQEGFGSYLDIKDNKIVVGAPMSCYEAFGSNSYLDLSGVVYVGQESLGGNWQINNGFVADDRAQFASFGYPVKFNDDGNIIVGAQGEKLDENGANSIDNAGAVYVVDYNGSLIQKIVPSNRDYNDYFSISISTYGDYIAVGAPFKEDNMDPEVGAAYIFKKDTSGNFVESQILNSENPGMDFRFGYTISMFDNKLVIGETGGDGNVFIYDKDTLNNWNFTDVVTNNQANDDYAGYISLYKNMLLVSARLNDLDENEQYALTDAGAVYFYRYCASNLSNNVINICDGDSIFVSGDYQTVSGIYYDTLLSKLYCDSVIETNLIVNANPTPFQIIGQTSVNEFETVIYSVPFDTNLIYHWFVNGGNVISFPSNNSVNIQWGTSAYGLISVVSSNASGCESDTVYLQVNIGSVGINGNIYSNVKVYPNPSNKFINIDGIDSFKELNIIDVYGNIVKSEIIIKSSIDISSLQKGIYFIRIDTDDSFIIKKFIKQ